MITGRGMFRNALKVLFTTNTVLHINTEKSWIVELPACTIMTVEGYRSGPPAVVCRVSFCRGSINKQRRRVAMFGNPTIFNAVGSSTHINWSTITVPWHSYTNILYTWQSLYELSLYRTDFIRDKVYTGQILYGDKIYTRTKFIRGQSLYGTKFIRWQSLYEEKVYTNFFHTALELKDIMWMLKTCVSYNQIIYEYVTVTVTAC